ncbi:hypothetical protein [Massiliimalia timonensis]|uniref:hypothetical protein n=1 Tax=Massiliimalia timonensis TaxID=1987501 RepID=UPI00189DF6E6|nr:hypothetical protein [Massiliimalia timonensis]
MKWEKISVLHDADAVAGIAMYPIESAEKIQEDYFTAYFHRPSFPFQDSSVKCNLIRTAGSTWPVSIDKVETHSEPEVFCFVEGISTMLFVDVHDSKPDLESAVLLKIPPGTVLQISKGKAHYIGPALTPTAVCMVVESAHASTLYYPLDQP